MSADLALILMGVVTILCIFFSIVYTAGIVWRVELELDSSYKFFLLSAIFLLASEILSAYYAQDSKIANEITVKALKTLFAISFLCGSYLMRDIVRKLDGEKTSKEEEEEEVRRRELEREMKERQR